MIIPCAVLMYVQAAEKRITGRRADRIYRVMILIGYAILRQISEYFTEHFKGDCLLAVGDDELIKIHFHTNEPWKVLEYCASLGEIYDIVVEDMDRQSRGLKG